MGRGRRFVLRIPISWLGTEVWLKTGGGRGVYFFKVLGLKPVWGWQTAGLPPPPPALSPERERERERYQSHI